MIGKVMRLAATFLMVASVPIAGLVGVEVTQSGSAFLVAAVAWVVGCLFFFAAWMALHSIMFPDDLH